MLKVTFERRKPRDRRWLAALRVQALGWVILQAWPTQAGEELGFHSALGEHSSHHKTPQLEVQLLASQAEAQAGAHLILGVYFRLQPHWHLYFLNPGDSGLAPQVNYQLPAGAHLGPEHWPTPHKIVQEPLVNYGYENELVLARELRFSAQADHGEGSFQVLQAQVRWLVCRQSCVPGQAHLELLLTAAAGQGVAGFGAKLLRRALAHAPQPCSFGLQGAVTPSTFQLWGAELRAPVDFYPKFPGQVAGQSTAYALQSSATGSVLELARAEGLTKTPAFLEGILHQIPSDQACWVRVSLDAQPQLIKKIDPPPSEPPAIDAPLTPPSPVDAPKTFLPPTPATSASSFFWNLWYAWLGGLILNVMPCVFPVLAIKALSLIQLSQEGRRTARLHALLYTLGNWLSFLLLAALIVAFRYVGGGLGWGFQLQSPGFVVAMMAILFFFGLNLLGVFELSLGLENLGQSLVQKSGRAGALFTGVFATLVATPCTAPLMGPAVAFGLTQSPPITVVIFTALSLGFSTPFLVLAYVPRLASFLPRPGIWMVQMKQLMAFLVWGSVLWLGWILSLEVGASHLMGALCLLLFLGFLAWLWNQFSGVYRSALRSMVFVLGLSSAGWCVYWVEASPLRTFGLSEHPPAELAWEQYTPDLIDRLRGEHRLILLDFTAAWCVSCQVNEWRVFRDARVQQALKRRQVALVRADWTQRQPQITAAITGFGRSGVPLYVFYGTDGRAQVLPEIIGPDTLLKLLGEGV